MNNFHFGGKEFSRWKHLHSQWIVCFQWKKKQSSGVYICRNRLAKFIVDARDGWNAAPSIARIMSRWIGIWSASWSVTLTRWTLQRFTCLASHLLAFSRLRGQESHDPSYEISTLPHVEVLNGGNRPGRRSKRRPNAGKMCGNLNIFTVCDQFYFAYFTHFWNIFSEQSNLERRNIQFGKETPLQKQKEGHSLIKNKILSS